MGEMQEGVWEIVRGSWEDIWEVVWEAEWEAVREALWEDVRGE